MNVNRFSNLITNLSLIGILIVLLLIWKRMPPTPPTNAEVRGAKTPVERRAIYLRQPLVTADAAGTLDVNVQSGAVEVLNASFTGTEPEPLKVKIVR